MDIRQNHGCGVREDEIGAGSLDGNEGFQQRSLGIDDALFGSCHHHGILAADVVGAKGKSRLLAEAIDHIEVEEGGLDHEHIGPLLLIELCFEERFAPIGRIHLVPPFVAKRGSGAQRIAKRGVEAGGVLGAVGQDSGIFIPFLIKSMPNCSDAPVHHVARGHVVHARSSQHNAHLLERFYGFVIEHIASLIHQSIVAVRGEGIERDVGKEAESGKCGFNLLNGMGDEPIAFKRLAAHAIFFLRIDHREKSRSFQPHIHEPLKLFDDLINREAKKTAHRRNSLPFSRALEHKEGSHQIGREKHCLCHQIPNRLCPSIPSWPLQHAKHSLIPLHFRLLSLWGLHHPPFCLISWGGCANLKKLLLCEERSLEGYEEFTESQIRLLKRFVTNTESNIFVLHNLPEVIKGALLSRYSRSSLGLRSLLLKDFILNEDTAFASIVGSSLEQEERDQAMAIKKAQNFYDRILDGFGDDSIGELGGAHLALENVSLLAAKAIEDARLGGSPLEKSTRYIYFDQKIDGEYLFYREPVLMTSAYRDSYVSMCNRLFDTYSSLIPRLTEVMEKKYPKEYDVSNVAYTAALRAKVLDCLRGLLPASALTNMGVFGNGRFYETLIQKLSSHNLAELQDIGRKAYTELSKAIPSFVRRAEPTHKYYLSTAEFFEQMQNEVKSLAKKYAASLERMTGPGLRLIHYDSDAPAKVAAALLFSSSSAGLYELQELCRSFRDEDLGRILDAASNYREHRRHKSPRALEHAMFTFEVVADFGVYRDLHRHRTLTQERQLLTCDFGYYVPSEIKESEMEQEYVKVMEAAKEVYENIAEELPEEAQYVVPMGYNIHWYFHINLRALQWLTELRSSPAGHPNYRYIVQEMAKQVIQVFPQFERFFKFVDFEGYELGRLGQEIRIVEKKGEGHVSH